MGQFATVVPIDHITAIVFNILIRLLDTASGWDVIARCCKPDLSRIRKRHLLLHQPLSERAASDDDAAVIVLNRTGDDL